MLEYKIVPVKELSLNQQHQIYQLMVISDREFIPPLSDRYAVQQLNLKPIIHNDVYEPELYFADIMKHNILIAVDNKDKIIGFLAYRLNTIVTIDNYRSIDADYISTIIVHPTWRQKGVAKALHQRLFQLPSVKAFMVRTWSTNTAYRKLLTDLQFGEIYTIKNDRCRGIDTNYYYRIINHIH